ncbi:hypothetical protein CUN67_01610 [Pantoea cypripedii]|uniref:Uncharacterized protein n=1 Tax=Pantoea cypripedii TaxID=55209 RepID=A0A6B9FZW4_PANCY|nr:hypothetical protein CUN67_01610 [Pantoea cypripedii]
MQRGGNAIRTWMRRKAACSGAIYRAKKSRSGEAGGAGPGNAKGAARPPLLGRRTGELQLPVSVANEITPMQT